VLVAKRQVGAMQLNEALGELNKLTTENADSAEKEESAEKPSRPWYEAMRDEDVQ